jgi:hypothetical protein
VTASDMARRPNRLLIGLTGNNQSVVLGGTCGEVLFSYGFPSSLVTVGDTRGDGKSFGGGAGRGGVLIELSEGVLRRPLIDNP